MHIQQQQQWQHYKVTMPGCLTILTHNVQNTTCRLSMSLITVSVTPDSLSLAAEYQSASIGL